MKYETRAIIWLEGNKWIAQGLEYDIAAQGSTKSSALNSLLMTFLGEVEIRKYNPSIAGCAPLEFWNKANEDGVFLYQLGRTEETYFYELY